MKKLIYISVVVTTILMMTAFFQPKSACNCDLKLLKNLAMNPEIIQFKKIRSCFRDKKMFNETITTIGFKEYNEFFFFQFYYVKEDTLFNNIGIGKNKCIYKTYSFPQSAKRDSTLLSHSLPHLDSANFFIVDYKFKPINIFDWEEKIIIPQSLDGYKLDYSIDTIYIQEYYH